MNVKYSEHALKRMRQRGITELEIKHIINHPDYVKKSFEGTKEAFGELNGRSIKIKFVETESYIKVITVM